MSRAPTKQLKVSKHRVRIIGGQWRRRLLPVLDIEGLRPTPDRVRETLFNWLGQELIGQYCLDLFAGSGALGFEAASRGAQKVILIERQAQVIDQLQANKQMLSADQVELRQIDARQFLKSYHGALFNLVFLDPPFQDTELLLDIIKQVEKYIQLGGYLYIEAGQPISLEEMALTNWSIYRCAKAGQVYYYLLSKMV